MCESKSKHGCVLLLLPVLLIHPLSICQFVLSIDCPPHHDVKRCCTLLKQSLITSCQDGNHNVVEASAEAEQEWVDTIISLARMNEKLQYVSACNTK